MRVISRILASLTAVALVLLASLGSASAIPRNAGAASPAQAQSTHALPTRTTAAVKGAPKGLTFPVRGPVSKGGTFKGAFTLKKLKKRHGHVTAYGTIRGIYKAPGKAPRYIKEKVSKVPVTIREGAATATRSSVSNAAFASKGAATAAVVPMQVPTGCDILILDLGPLHLDLLGLVLDLSPVHLSLVAVPGAGNLLGNLLCAVAGLLDPGAPLQSLLSRILGVVNQILSRLRSVVPAA